MIFQAKTVLLNWAPDYDRLGPLSDGRTCHGVLPRGVNFDKGMCDDPRDDLRRPSLPDSPELALALSRQMSGPMAFVGYALPREWTNGTWVSDAGGFNPEVGPI